MNSFIYGNFFDLTSDIYEDKLSIGVMSPDRHVIEFVIGSIQPFEELFDVYCCREAVNRRNLQFKYNNKILNPSDVPLGLMKTGAKITVSLIA